MYLMINSSTSVYKRASLECNVIYYHGLLNKGARVKNN